MNSLSRRVCILMVVCSLLAEGLLVEAKGGRGRSRGGYSYGGGGGDLPTWALILIIVFSAISIISILMANSGYLNSGTLISAVILLILIPLPEI